MTIFFAIIFIFAFHSTTITALEPRDIVILILSQETKYNSDLAEKLEQNIFKQAKDVISGFSPLVYLSHRDFPHVGDWTVLPILPRIFTEHQNAIWLFICTERTQINLQKLIQVLQKYNNSQEAWYGFALYDREATIIHHFAFYENTSSFLYPNMASGLVMSMPLVQKISDRFSSENEDQNSENDPEFSIDASHELALYIRSLGQEISFTHDPQFCISKDDNLCATFINSFIPCDESITDESLYFAVKTCKKFHNNRIPVVKNTWAKYIANIKYFSDVSDDLIPTISLNIPNTEQGHCEKTFAILKFVYTSEIQKNSKIKWLVLVDDDTIISPSNLRNLLSCYKDTKILALGERYGYKVNNLEGYGYNYITGGAGTVLSTELIRKIIENPENCKCPSINSPDDMFLGVCLSRLAVKITHSPHFHQARPNDYAPEYLSRKEAISFHKHWMINPISVYEEWFEEDDRKEYNKKTEL